MKSTLDELVICLSATLSDIPDHDLAIPRATHDGVLVEPDAARAEIRVACQHFHNLSSLVVPDTHGVVRTAGQHLRIVW